MQERETNMSKNLIPNKWETEHLRVEDSKLAEVEELQKINDVVPQTREWTQVEGKEVSENSILAALREGVLPLKGSKEFFRLQSIRLRETGELIGFLGMYHGFPRDEIFWINTVTLHPKFQGKGYGPELMLGLSNLVRQSGYTHMRTFVSLTNWPSLRLCVKVGMNKMVKIVGDKIYSEKAEAHTMLEKELLG